MNKKKLSILLKKKSLVTLHLDNTDNFKILTLKTTKYGKIMKLKFPWIYSCKKITSTIKLFDHYYIIFTKLIKYKAK